MSSDASNEKFNPFQAPTTDSDGAIADDSESAQIRREHLKHEASVKSMGALYLIGGVVLTIFPLLNLIAARSATRGIPGMDFYLRIAMFSGLGILQFCSGLGLRRLAPWSRITGALVALAGVLFALRGFSVGSLVSLYVLYLLLSQKGKMVFSTEYRDVIEKTPHIRYRTSPIVWFFLILLLGLIFLAVGAAVFSGLAGA